MLSQLSDQQGSTAARTGVPAARAAAPRRLPTVVIGTLSMPGILTMYLLPLAYPWLSPSAGSKSSAGAEQ